MNIRLTKGPYAGLVVQHNDHIAHELIRRGLAEDASVSPVVETAAKPEPAAAEHATVTHHRRKGGRS